MGTTAAQELDLLLQGKACSMSTTSSLDSGELPSCVETAGIGHLAQRSSPAGLSYVALLLCSC